MTLDGENLRAWLKFAQNFAMKIEIIFATYRRK